MILLVFVARFIGETLGDSIGKYSGICQAQSTGRLYATPWNGQRILEIDASGKQLKNFTKNVYFRLTITIFRSNSIVFVYF